MKIFTEVRILLRSQAAILRLVKVIDFKDENDL